MSNTDAPPPHMGALTLATHWRQVTAEERVARARRVLDEALALATAAQQPKRMRNTKLAPSSSALESHRKGARRAASGALNESWYMHMAGQFDSPRPGQEAYDAGAPFVWKDAYTEHIKAQVGGGLSSADLARMDVVCEIDLQMFRIKAADAEGSAVHHLIDRLLGEMGLGEADLRYAVQRLDPEEVDRFVARAKDDALSLAGAARDDLVDKIQRLRV